MSLRRLAGFWILFLLSVVLLQAAAGDRVPFWSFLAGVVIVVAPRAFWPPRPERRRRELTDPLASAELRRLSQLAGLYEPAAPVRPVGWKTSLENAYVRPGRPATLVFHDRLFERSDPRRITAVIAHKLGHVLHHDFLIQASALPVLGVGLGLGLERLLRAATVLSMTGSVRPGAAREAPLLLLLFGVTWVVGRVAIVRIRRSQESAADRFGLGLTGDLEGFERLNISLATRSLEDQYPSRLQKLFFGTHPTATERIAAARRDVCGGA
jgi:STE24 endopeptidase